MREFLIEYWEFVRAKKAYWLVPLLLTVLVAAAFLVLAQGTAYAPFVYTFF